MLHLYKGYPPTLGGIEGHLQTLARGQAARGLAVTVLVAGDDRTTRCERDQEVTVIRAGSIATLRSTPLCPTMPLHLARAEPDIVHLHAPFPPGELAQWVLVRGQATVISYHSDIVRQRWLGALWRPWQRRLLLRAGRVLVASEAYRKSSPMLRPAGPTSTAPHSAIVPYGIEVERFAHADVRRVARWRQRFAAPRVLFVGRLRYYKGVGHLIAAADHLWAGAPSPGSLLIAGRGPREQAWRQQAAASCVGESIHFLGDIAPEELPALYASADVCVLPSTKRSEAFGIVLLEAMAAGLPVISTELGTGTSEVNIDGVTGRVLPAGNSQALATALGPLLEDPALRQRMGEAAAQRAERHYRSEQMVAAVIEIYEQLMVTARRSLRARR